ncbi:cecropin-C-like [Anopheles nili]|uniref:cecropin-C-like n=1 Tax=Anopheles nili TaxID=185578 RepID=UPI00237A5953|nr:cecropin-C-like [Anopheles nili]
MNFKLIFLVSMLLMAVFLGQSEAAPFRKFVRRLRGAGRRVGNVVRKVAPVVAGAKAVIG